MLGWDGVWEGGWLCRWVGMGGRVNRWVLDGGCFKIY